MICSFDRNNTLFMNSLNHLDQPDPALFSSKTRLGRRSASNPVTPSARLASVPRLVPNLCWLARIPAVAARSVAVPHFQGPRWQVGRPDRPRHRSPQRGPAQPARSQSPVLGLATNCNLNFAPTIFAGHGLCRTPRSTRSGPISETRLGRRSASNPVTPSARPVGPQIGPQSLLVALIPAVAARSCGRPPFPGAALAERGGVRNEPDTARREGPHNRRAHGRWSLASATRSRIVI